MIIFIISWSFLNSNNNLIDIKWTWVVVQFGLVFFEPWKGTTNEKLTIKIMYQPRNQQHDTSINVIVHSTRESHWILISQTTIRVMNWVDNFFQNITSQNDPCLSKRSPLKTCHDVTLSHEETRRETIGGQWNIRSDELRWCDAMSGHHSFKWL